LAFPHCSSAAAAAAAVAVAVAVAVAAATVTLLRTPPLRLPLRVGAHLVVHEVVLPPCLLPEIHVC
jgi:hypothetical protein